MIPHLFFYQLVLLGWLWLFFMLHDGWPQRSATAPQRPTEPIKPKRNRSHEPNPFEGLTYKPHCVACEHEATHPKASPPVRPDPMPPTHRRPRQVDTSHHFCPHAGCDYRGWVASCRQGGARRSRPCPGCPWSSACR
jgi:hypothetical protein